MLNFHRLDWRLPFAVAVLLLLISGALVALTYGESRRGAVETAELRLQTLVRQLGSNLQENATALMRQAEASAADADLIEVVSGRQPPDELRQRFETRLKDLPQTFGVQVWTAAGAAVLSVAAEGAPTMPAPWDGFPRWASQEGVKMSPPVASDGTGIYAIAAPVRVDGELVGFFVTRRRVVSGGGSRELLEQLIGPRTRILVGQPGGVWVDLLGDAIEAPLGVESDDRGVYWVRHDNQPWMGALHSIEGMPWSLRVEFPASVVFGPSWSLLKNTSVVALLLTALGTFGGWVISRRMLGPLRALTRAATEVADGTLTPEVPFTRPDEIGNLAAAFNIMARRVTDGRRQLEARVQERTDELTTALAQVRAHARQLEGSNRELESFCYTISHDLRAPLRSIDGFSEALESEHAHQLDQHAMAYLRRVRRAAKRMDQLITDLLELAKVSRVELTVRPVALNDLAERAVNELREREPGRTVDVVIHPDLKVDGDPRLLTMAVQNLVENAWKFTGTRPQARIECGAEHTGGAVTYFVRDNGVGFDMAHAGKLFGIFQRLHSMDQFPGTGVGLAIVQRVIERHGGRIWADAVPDGGATFYFTLEGSHG